MAPNAWAGFSGARKWWQMRPVSPSWEPGYAAPAVKTGRVTSIQRRTWWRRHCSLRLTEAGSITSQPPKILTVAFTWLRVEPPEDEEPPDNQRRRYVMGGAVYQRLADAVKPGVVV